MRINVAPVARGNAAQKFSKKREFRVFTGPCLFFAEPEITGGTGAAGIEFSTQTQDFRATAPGHGRALFHTIHIRS
jgi:hypothetical protein